jgi:hypothetical protein
MPLLHPAVIHGQKRRGIRAYAPLESDVDHAARCGGVFTFDRNSLTLSGL